MNSTPRPLSIGCILANNFTLSVFARFVDYLGSAAHDDRFRASHLVTWRVMSHNGCDATASCDVRVPVHSSLTDPNSFDYIVVIGGSLHRGRQVEDATADYLVAAAAAGMRLVGLCTGSFILCRLGLMRGRTCCVSWRHRQDFIDEFPGAPVVVDRHFLADGDRITCGGGAGTAHLATYLLNQRGGRSSELQAGQVVLLGGLRL